ncbi:GNAT family N-acetyltransferase [Ideonella sp. BN130291]|uniref:GNAT family N-acetyltransferase n=1 Tax=Ideonella sp. BN130291 TaxID=3112940 RepID=UPI002E26090E|nr:GNAT family N-acetyltransferase [Ideonella sp. BN130291]
MNNCTPAWHLRPAGEADVPALAALYADTARALGSWCYTPQQVAAWARFAADGPGFHDYVAGASTWIAQQDHGAAVLGFCGVDDSGEVRSLYVAAAATRQGIGSALLRHALGAAQQRGLQRFCAWATPFSVPVFQRAGFVLARVVTEPFQGVVFDRFRMER